MDRLVQFLARLDDGARRIGRRGIDAVTEVGETKNFVNGHPICDAVTQALDGLVAILGIVLRHFTAAP